MASNAELQRVESRDWSELIQKTLEDGTRVVSAELRLFEKNVSELCEAQADRVLGALAVMAAVMYGGALILIGCVFLLNLWLSLWLSFVAVGAATALAGATAHMVLSRRAPDIEPSTIVEGTGKPVDTLVRENVRG